MQKLSKKEKLLTAVALVLFTFGIFSFSHAQETLPETEPVELPPENPSEIPPTEFELNQKSISEMQMGLLTITTSTQSGVITCSDSNSTTTCNVQWYCIMSDKNFSLADFEWEKQNCTTTINTCITRHSGFTCYTPTTTDLIISDGTNTFLLHKGIDYGEIMILFFLILFTLVSISLGVFGFFFDKPVKIVRKRL